MAAAFLLAGLVQTARDLDRLRTTAELAHRFFDATTEMQLAISLGLDSLGADAGNDALLERAGRLDDAYRQVAGDALWSGPLQQVFYGTGSAMPEAWASFVAASRGLQTATRAEQSRLIADMRQQAADGLFTGLDTKAQMVADALASRTDSVQSRRTLLLWAAAVLMLAAGLRYSRLVYDAIVTIRTELLRQDQLLQDTEMRIRDANAQLNFVLNHDALTGLPNRASLTTGLGALMAQEDRGDIGVLFVGLDGFKTINDTIGHQQADELLISVADTLRLCVDEDDLVARVGGDEFVMTTTEPPGDLAERTLATMEKPFTVSGRRITVGTSIGYLATSPDATDPAEAIRDAGIALQAAKSAGGRRAMQFSESMREQKDTMNELRRELPDAIESGQIEPWFQPQMHLSDGSLYGAEVLARWRHPTRGLLTPDKFLTVAEQSGMIIEMDHAVWRKALAQVSAWQDKNLWHHRISLNAGPDTIADPQVIERLLKKLHNSPLGVDQITVEVLETTLIEGADDMAAINIDGLAECGIGLELDDFGTGFASLSKLTQLPLSGIKIDRSLIAPLPERRADSVVRAILALATELDLHVVAEGIEETLQADHLNLCGCAIGQGYSFARPMDADSFAKWLEANTASLAAGSRSTAGGRYGLEQ